MNAGEPQVREAAPAPGASIKERESIPALVREAVDGLIELVGAHIKLTNLELIADLQTKTREFATRAAVGLAALLGYAFLLIALALALTPAMSPWVAFAAIGGVHVAGAGIAAWVLSRRRLRALRVAHEIESVGRSMTAVADAVLGIAEHPDARH